MEDYFEIPESTKNLILSVFQKYRKELPITPDAIDSMNTVERWLRIENGKAWASCECGYETELMSMKNLNYKLSEEGGYIISDKAGGYDSKCPKCEGNKLEFHTD